jgi:hypothetical protein
MSVTTTTLAIVTLNYTNSHQQRDHIDIWQLSGSDSRATWYHCPTSGSATRANVHIDVAATKASEVAADAVEPFKAE